MRIKSTAMLLVLFALATNVPLAFSQQSATNNWPAVQQIRTNSKVYVKQKNGDDISGLMIEATDTTLTIDRKGKPVSIARADIRQVKVSIAKAEKGKWAWIGTGIGTAAGAGIGAIAANGSLHDSGPFIGVGMLLGAGVGAVTGMLIGDSKRERDLVYSVF